MQSESEIKFPDIIYVNSRSLNKNHEKHRNLCLKLKPRILMCSETRVRKDLYDRNEKKFAIDGYVLKLAYTPNGRTGGVGVYIRKSIRHEMVEIKPGKFTWGIAFKITEDNYLKGTFGVVYRSHLEKRSDFIAFMKIFAKELTKTSGKVLIAGDMNLKLNKMMTARSSEYKYLEAMKTYNLHQIVDEPTREGNLIDHVFTTNTNWISCTVNRELMISDHCTVEMRLND